MIKINMVKTDVCCFISDCNAASGYDWNYHRSKLKDLFFDGERPEPTFSVNWLKISQYPSSVQELQSIPSINKRYEIKNINLASEQLPSVIKYDDIGNYSEDILSLYSYKEDKQDPILVDVEYDIDVVMEIENFELPPIINYKAIKKTNFNNQEFFITNTSVSHQLFDKLIFPEVMLHTRPCSMSSQNLFCLVRQHIINNIDNKVAKITSNYDFCFEVKKIIPLIEPQKISCQNIFASTKKERNKIHYTTKAYKEVSIFEMTHDQSKYDRYTPIKPIFADNETELKEKIDRFLEGLMEVINHPLCLCPNCNGTGYLDDIKKIKQDDLVNER